MSTQKNVSTSSSSDVPSASVQLGVFIAFVVLGCVGVWYSLHTDAKQQPVRRDGPAVRRTVAPIRTSKPTDSQLALTAPTGHSVVDKMIRQQQSKVYSMKTDPARWVQLGYMWVRKARRDSQPLFYRNADACARVALSLDQTYRMALNLKALSLMQQHAFLKALRVGQSILALRKDDAMAWGTVSDAQLELGHYKQAIDAAQKMMDLKPNLPSYIRAAHLLWIQGHFYQARDLIRHAYDAGRGQKDREPVAWVLTEAAWMHWHEGDYKGAEAGFDLALRQVSAYPDAVVGKAQIAMIQKRYSEAVTWLQQAFKSRTTARIAWLLGDACSAAKNTTCARRAYQAVERLGRREDYRTLAHFYAAQHRKPKAALRFAQLEYNKRKDIYTEDAYAWAWMRNGKFRKAELHARRANRLGTRDASLWFHLGAILVANGKMSEGLTWIRKALSLNPYFQESGRKEAIQILKMAQLKIPKRASLTYLKPPKKKDKPVDLNALPARFKIKRSMMKTMGLRAVLKQLKERKKRAAPTTQPVQVRSRTTPSQRSVQQNSAARK